MGHTRWTSVASVICGNPKVKPQKITIVLHKKANNVARLYYTTKHGITIVLHNKACLWSVSMSRNVAAFSCCTKVL